MILYFTEGKCNNTSKEDSTEKAYESATDATLLKTVVKIKEKYTVVSLFFNITALLFNSGCWRREAVGPWRPENQSLSVAGETGSSMLKNAKVDDLLQDKLLSGNCVFIKHFPPNLSKTQLKGKFLPIY